MLPQAFQGHPIGTGVLFILSLIATCCVGCNHPGTAINARTSADAVQKPLPEQLRARPRVSQQSPRAAADACEHHQAELRAETEPFSPQQHRFSFHHSQTAAANRCTNV